MPSLRPATATTKSEAMLLASSMQMLKCTQVTGPVQEWKWHQVQNVNLKNKGSSSSTVAKQKHSSQNYLEKERPFLMLFVVKRKENIHKKADFSSFSPNF